MRAAGARQALQTASPSKERKSKGREHLRSAPPQKDFASERQQAHTCTWVPASLLRIYREGLS